MRRLELMNGVVINIDGFYDSVRFVEENIEESCRVDIGINSELKPKELAKLIKNNFDGTLRIATGDGTEAVVYEGLEFGSVNFSINEKGTYYSAYFNKVLE